MEFVNETKYDFEFNFNVSMQLWRRIRIVLGILVLVISVCCAALFAAKIFTPEDVDQDVFLVAILCSIADVFLAALFFGFRAVVQFYVKKIMRGKEEEIRYVFSEHDYEQTKKLWDGTTNTLRDNYNTFVRCKEYADFWLFYRNTNRLDVFSVSKSGMAEGTAEQFTEFLIDHFGRSYQKCFKNKSK